MVRTRKAPDSVHHVDDVLPCRRALPGVSRGAYGQRVTVASAVRCLLISPESACLQEVRTVGAA